MSIIRRQDDSRKLRGVRSTDLPDRKPRRPKSCPVPLPQPIASPSASKLGEVTSKDVATADALRPVEPRKVGTADHWPESYDNWHWETVEPPDSDIDLSAFAIASPPEPEPTPRSEAWNNGWARGHDLDDEAAPPAEMDASLKTSWWAGFFAGQDRRMDDDTAIDRAEASHREPCFEELVEAAGVEVARAW